MEGQAGVERSWAYGDHLMARPDDPHPDNVPGEWYVDTRCIDCDASRQVAPGLFERVDGQSVVTHQPQTDEDVRTAWLAALACPTRSIHVRTGEQPPADLYPHELADGVHYCGYNSTKSFGANAFLAVRPAGNVMVDSPQFVRPLVDAVDRLGGLTHILLTHRDDVADADRWAERFGARVWIHEDDASAAPYATDLLEGTDDTPIRDDLAAIPVPGHTRGSVCFLLDQRFLFTGDSLYWSRRRQDLGAHRAFTWYSWEEQADSLERLAREHRFEWVLAGHGDRGHRPADEMELRLLALVDRMRAA